MKKSHIIPVAALPYALVFALAFFFAYFNIPTVQELCNTESGSIVAFVIYFGIIIGFFNYAIIAYAFGIAESVCNLKNNEDPLSVAKAAMIIKLCQIPAYVFLFLLGCILGMMPFTFAHAFVIIIIEFGTLVVMGIYTASAVVAAVRQGKICGKNAVWYIIFQFIYCVDIVVSVLLYLKLKKANATGIADDIKE